MADLERKITTRFTCRDGQSLPADFKGLDISKFNDGFRASQLGYLDKIDTSSELNNATKPEFQRSMTGSEISSLRSDAGKLAWIATGTSPLSAYHASVALQRNRDQKIPPLQFLADTRKALMSIKERRLSVLTYTPLDSATIHIRVYSDGSFQNLATKP